MQCPACAQPLAGDAIECPHCGVILAKWHRKPERTRATFKPRRTSGATVFVALAIPLALLAIAAYLLMRNPPAKVIEELSNTLELQDGVFPQFDARLVLPGSPGGIASNGSELVIANRKDPWGFIRLRERDGKFVAEKIPLIEPVYSQKMSLNTLTWNGTNYVGITTAAWFGKETSDVFTIHDPVTLQVVRHTPAPPLLGCLAWDGTSYWASTRKNTADAHEQAFLYHLDRDFNVIAKHEPPAVGCQGLMWERSRLWFADVFNDSIYVLDVASGEPRLIHKAELGLSYPSGVVLHDRAIWIAEYGKDQLFRVRTASRIAWAGGIGVDTAAASMTPITMTSGGSKNPIRFARDIDSFPKRGPEDTEDLEWSVELRDGAVWLNTSRIWFGPELFAKRAQNSSVVTVPEFARYTFTVELPDGREVEKQFDAVAGENVRMNERLADATLDGEYSVSLFIHVQYVDASGAGRILNDSAGVLELRR